MIASSLLLLVQSLLHGSSTTFGVKQGSTRPLNDEWRGGAATADSADSFDSLGRDAFGCTPRGLKKTAEKFKNMPHVFVTFIDFLPGCADAEFDREIRGSCLGRSLHLCPKNEWTKSACERITGNFVKRGDLKKKAVFLSDTHAITIMETEKSHSWKLHQYDGICAAEGISSMRDRIAGYSVGVPVTLHVAGLGFQEVSFSADVFISTRLVGQSVRFDGAQVSERGNLIGSLQRTLRQGNHVEMVSQILDIATDFRKWRKVLFSSKRAYKAIIIPDMEIMAGYWNVNATTKQWGAWLFDIDMPSLNAIFRDVVLPDVPCEFKRPANGCVAVNRAFMIHMRLLSIEILLYALAFGGFQPEKQSQQIPQSFQTTGDIVRIRRSLEIVLLKTTEDNKFLMNSAVHELEEGMKAWEAAVVHTKTPFLIQFADDPPVLNEPYCRCEGPSQICDVQKRHTRHGCYTAETLF